MSDNISNSTLTESLNESIINSVDDEFVNDTDTSTVVGDDEILSDIDSDVETKIESKQGEEKIEEIENTKNCQTEKIICGICYKDLYVGNSVTTIYVIIVSVTLASFAGWKLTLSVLYVEHQLILKQI